MSYGFRLGRLFALRTAAVLISSACGGSKGTSMVPTTSTAPSTQSGMHPNFGGGYTLTDLGTLPGDSASKAFALNATGQVAGISENPSAATATLFANGTTVNIDTVGATVTLAQAINASNQVAGEIVDSGHAFLYSGGAIFPNTYYTFKAGKHVGFIVHNGNLVDLNKLISGTGFTITDALGINDAGQIAADAKNSAGQPRAVLLTPK